MRTTINQMNQELSRASWDTVDTARSLSFCAEIIVRKHFDLRPSEVDESIQSILEDYAQTVLWASRPLEAK